jgi:hypothetical protein
MVQLALFFFLDILVEIAALEQASYFRLTAVLQRLNSMPSKCIGMYVLTSPTDPLGPWTNWPACSMDRDCHADPLLRLIESNHFGISSGRRGVTDGLCMIHACSPLSNRAPAEIALSISGRFLEAQKPSRSRGSMVEAFRNTYCIVSCSPVPLTSSRQTGQTILLDGFVPSPVLHLNAKPMQRQGSSRDEQQHILLAGHWLRRLGSCVKRNDGDDSPVARRVRLPTDCSPVLIFD